ncbi:MAG: right-handed parallel beta-helix repeat-containing protein, partial [Actinobacteria bacterium]|nr:right-handed parallel beta-helix repeat-containing protein [Actinomycetota bacterium]
LTASMVLSLTGSVYWGGSSWVSNGSSGESYGPLTMKFQSPVVGTRAAATYYVDNRTGSNCDDRGSGTSASTPWCSFEPVNVASGFAAGSSILLARGATFLGPMKIRGSGTSIAWNSIGAFGSGARPIITGGGVATGRTISMTNPNYWSVSGLEIEDAGVGIIVKYNTVGNHGLRFTDLYIHDLDFYVQGSPKAVDGGSYWSTSITVGATGIDPEGASIIDGVEISNVRAVNATAPALGGATFGLVTGTVDVGAVTNAVIRNNSFSDSNGGMSLQSVSDSIVRDNFISGMGKDAKATGQTSLFLWHTKRLDISNNVITNTANTGSVDESALDLEGYNDDIYIRGNYFGENPGPGVEVLALSGRPGDHNSNITIEENTFHGNGTSGSSVYRGGVLFGINTSAPQSGTIGDNLFYEPNGGLQIGMPSSWTATGNTAVASSSDLTHNGRDFTASPWSYEQTSGSSYSALTASGGYWTGANGALVAPTDMLPPTGTDYTTRSWTAPHGGTVTIRSHAALTDPASDGVAIRITKNGTTIWPGAGAVTTLSPSTLVAAYAAATHVSVVPGDVIRFEVSSGPSGNNASDWLSWSPSIGYE